MGRQVRLRFWQRKAHFYAPSRFYQVWAQQDKVVDARSWPFTLVHAEVKNPWTGVSFPYPS
jgi:GH43 family beta-xylosidase